MDYPKALVPVDPVISLGTFAWPDAAHVSSVLDVAHVRHVTSGRMAIGLALQQMGIGAGDEVLMPAYHSRSMVEPVLWRGAQPVFFRVKQDAAIDLQDVAAKITPRSKLLVAVNYFGFPQDLLALRAFCDARGLLLLEDCAHAFQGAHAGRPLGSFGDFAIASSMKFFPVYDGGCLLSSTRPLAAVHLRSAGLKFELKTVFNTVERAFAYGRLPLLGALLWLPLRWKDRLWGRLKTRKAGSPHGMQEPARAASLHGSGPRASDGAFGFEAEWLDKRASWCSRMLLRTAARHRAAIRRRANYLLLQDALGNLPGCAPLHPRLPPDVYPWVFPLQVFDPAQVFPALKFARVPVVRFGEFLWDGVDDAVCANSVRLSRSVMQFPCHQALKPAELAWMIERITAVLRESAAGVGRAALDPGAGIGADVASMAGGSP